MLTDINPVDIAVRQFEKHCGYCTTFCTDLMIEGIAASTLLGVSVESVGICPSCGMTWQFDGDTFLLGQTENGDNYWSQPRK